MKKENAPEVQPQELTLEDYQNIVAAKDAEITALKSVIDDLQSPDVLAENLMQEVSDLKKSLDNYSEIVVEKDNKIAELQEIIDTQDNTIESTEKVVIADSEKQKILDAGLIPVLIKGELKGAVTNVFNGVHLDKLTEEDIDELDSLGTVFITVE